MSAASTERAEAAQHTGDRAGVDGAAVTADGHGHHLRVTGAGRDYGKVRALDCVDLEVSAGKFLVLLGPSGSGKTTLVRALAGIERLDRGTIEIGGRTVDEARRHVPPERRDLAMVFQDYALWPHLTAAGNVGYALRRRKLPPDQFRSLVFEALNRVGLAELAERYPQELSGGQQQRVALARAVVARPGLLLFDEPLSNLDTDLRERLRVEIATLTREAGSTAVYITHDQAEAFALADVIGVLDQGRLVQLAEPETLYHSPATPFVARFTGLSGELAGTVRAFEGRVAVVAAGPWLLRARAMGRIGVGDDVRVLIRPAATAFAELPGEYSGDQSGDLSADDGSAAFAAASAAPGAIFGRGSGLAPGQVDGVVVDVAYRGRGYDHVIACGPDTLAAVFAPRARARGSRVRLALDPEGCIAYPSTLDGGDRYDEKLTTVSAVPSPRAATGQRGGNP